MDFLDLAKKRYSVRKYKTQIVQEADLQRILEAGRVAPTGCNAQPQRLIVVREEEGLQKIKKGANIFGAPLAIIVCVNHQETWKRAYDGKDIADIDASIVTDHMMLQATELGLGSVWICSFNSNIIRNEFMIPKEWEPVNILAIGYAEGEVKTSNRHDTQRKPLLETVFYETLKH